MKILRKKTLKIFSKKNDFSKKNSAIAIYELSVLSLLLILLILLNGVSGNIFPFVKVIHSGDKHCR